MKSKTKNLELSKKIYNSLENLKLKGETSDELMIRLMKRTAIYDLIGMLSDEEAEAFREQHRKLNRPAMEELECKWREKNDNRHMLFH